MAPRRQGYICSPVVQAKSWRLLSLDTWLLYHNCRSCTPDNQYASVPPSCHPVAEVVVVVVAELVAVMVVVALTSQRCPSSRKLCSSCSRAGARKKPGRVAGARVPVRLLHEEDSTLAPAFPDEGQGKQ
jgi:hypothetical protein